MNLIVELKIVFDDDEETVITRRIRVENLPSINPTHAIVKAVIVE